MIMMYTVYSIVNSNGLINEDIMLETEDIEKAKEQAKRIANYNELEKNPSDHSVEIRFNENYDAGTYETVEF